MKLGYDSSITVSYGYYRCQECKSEFYGGGEAIHQSSCIKKGYESCILVIGDKQIAEVIRLSQVNGDDFSWQGVTLNDLREQLPEYVP